MLRVIVVVAALVLAGCVDENVIPAEPDEFGLDVDSMEGRGLIRGVVVDDAIVPVQGAFVEVLAQEAVIESVETDELGRFAFGNLEPGTYFLQVSSLQHQSVQLAVEVEADNPTPPVVKVQVSRLFSKAPYVDQQYRQGYINCGYSIGLSSPCIIDYTQLVYPGGAVPQLYGISGDVRRFVMPIGPGWQNNILEVAWEPSAAALSKALSMTISFYNRTTSQSYGGTSGESPLHLRMDMDPELVHPEFVGPDGQHDFLAFVNPNSAGSTVPFVAVTIEQEFELFMHTFYHGLAPPDWSFVAGDQPPF